MFRGRQLRVTLIFQRIVHWDSLPIHCDCEVCVWFCLVGWLQYTLSAGKECTCFGSTYTKIGTIQRRLAWPLRKDDTQNREAFHIFCPGPCHHYHSIVIGSNNHVVCFAGMRVRRLNSFLYGHIWHYFCVPDFQVQNGCMELLWFSLSHFGQTLSKRPSLNSLITLLKRCVSQMQPKHCKLSCWPMKAPRSNSNTDVEHVGSDLGSHRFRPRFT